MLRLMTLRWQPVSAFWLLVAYLFFVFMTGGGSRDDIQSLIVLRPVAVIICGIAFLSLRRQHLQAYRAPFAIAAAIIALVALHLVPLPPAIWQILPGRDLLVEVDRVADVGMTWRPISLVPAATWNALYALFVPLAVLLLGVQLSADERLRLLPVLLILGLLSGFWGLLQSISSPDGPLYLYRQTTNGAAVGLFANRNHQAILLACLFPMLAVFAIAEVRSHDQAKFKAWLAIALGAVLVPLILVTGSRAGIVAGIVGLAWAFALYRKPHVSTPIKRKVQKFDPRPALVGFAVLCIGGLTIIMSRAEAFRRLTQADQSEELRFKMWAPIVEMTTKYLPFGSGIGSFVKVYQIDEPDALLDLSYVNHAHNDWLELYLTAGVPGVVLLTITLTMLVRSILGAFGRATDTSKAGSHARLGASIIIILALASLVDYPLRVPSLACVLVVAVLWLASRPAQPSEKGGGV